MATMVVSDISPRTTAHADKRLLKRAKLNNILGQFGQSRTQPKGKGVIIKFRRYNRLDATPVILQEGVTPTGKILTKTDVQATLNQYGDWVGITDVIEDTHEDPVLREAVDVLGEQAPEMIDLTRAGVLKAGTNVFYANGTSRATVNDIFDADTFRTIERALNLQYAKPLREVINAGVNIATSPIAAAFVAVCHSDLKPDFERLASNAWTPVHKYASTNGLIQGEIGSVGAFRVVVDNNVTKWEDAGTTAATNSTLSTSGTNSDVYPILIFGKDAYGIVQLAGKGSVNTYVNNPKAINGDELAQRGSVGWKGWTTTAILNDLWMARLETAAKG
jgi:N4-gp56 family major capsid protein